jgi:hypothetical protein
LRRRDAWENGAMLRLAILTSLLAACVGPYTYTGRTTAAPRSYADGCPFEVFTLPPPSGYQEIGVVEGGRALSTLDRFRSAIDHEVCSHGGDAVVALANGLGNYIKGTVLRRTDAAPTAATP